VFQDLGTLVEVTAKDVAVLPWGGCEGDVGRRRAGRREGARPLTIGRVVPLRMVAPARQYFSFAEYLALEEIAAVKHEFLDGHVWAMAGGTPAHAAIAANVIALLSVQLRGRPCRVFTSDLRIRVLATGLGTYPDVTVVCGRLEADPADPQGNTVTNPLVLVEVLSPSTAEYDRGEKLSHYQRIPSLAEVVLVAHDERRLEIWRREGDHWTLDVFRVGERARLASIESDLVVADVYRDPLAS
jgi:Uma2 family endonuclease